MDTEQARTFLAIAAHGSFIAAASQLHLTQSTVSARIQRLEETLNARLFVRNRSGASLTPAGRRFLEYAKRLVFTATEAEISRSEVEQAVGRAVVSAAPKGGFDGEKLSQSIARHLQRYFDLHGDQLPPPGLYDRILREIEKPLLEIALDATGGNQLRCADLLGINRNTLRKKLTDLNIEVTRRRKLM